MCGKLGRWKEATVARVQGSVENVASGGLAFAQRKGCGVVVRSLNFIFSATGLVYSVILLTAAWRGDCGGEAGRQGPLGGDGGAVPGRAVEHPTPWRRAGKQLGGPGMGIGVQVEQLWGEQKVRGDASGLSLEPAADSESRACRAGGTPSAER